MKKILVDTNVILDFALAREPFVNQAEAILELAFQKKVMAVITASTIREKKKTESLRLLLSRVFWKLLMSPVWIKKLSVLPSNSN